MTFPGDRRIATRHGLLDVQVRHREDGRVWARLVRPEDHPELAAVTGLGGDEYEAVGRLRSAVDALHVERWNVTNGVTLVLNPCARRPRTTGSTVTSHDSAVKGSRRTGNAGPIACCWKRSMPSGTCILLPSGRRLTFGTLAAVRPRFSTEMTR